MKITFEDFAKALGNARLDFYRFYAPSWAESASLDRLRSELAQPVKNSRRDSRAAAARPGRGRHVATLVARPLARAA